jgi:hypothetical protein
MAEGLNCILQQSCAQDIYGDGLVSLSVSPWDINELWAMVLWRTEVALLMGVDNELFENELVPWITTVNQTRGSSSIGRFPATAGDGREENILEPCKFSMIYSP